MTALVHLRPQTSLGLARWLDDERARLTRVLVERAAFGLLVGFSLELVMLVRHGLARACLDALVRRARA